MEALGVRAGTVPQDAPGLASAPPTAAVDLNNKRKAVEAAENTHHVTLPTDAPPADLGVAANKRACVAGFPEGGADVVPSSLEDWARHRPQEQQQQLQEGGACKNAAKTDMQTGSQKSGTGDTGSVLLPPATGLSASYQGAMQQQQQPLLQQQYAQPYGMVSASAAPAPGQYGHQVAARNGLMGTGAGQGGVNSSWQRPGTAPATGMGAAGGGRGGGGGTAALGPGGPTSGNTAIGSNPMLAPGTAMHSLNYSNQNNNSSSSRMGMQPASGALGATGGGVGVMGKGAGMGMMQVQHPPGGPTGIGMAANNRSTSYSMGMQPHNMSNVSMQASGSGCMGMQPNSTGYSMGMQASGAGGMVGMRAQNVGNVSGTGMLPNSMGSMGMQAQNVGNVAGMQSNTMGMQANNPTNMGVRGLLPNSTGYSMGMQPNSMGGMGMQPKSMGAMGMQPSSMANMGMGGYGAQQLQQQQQQHDGGSGGAGMMSGDASTAMGGGMGGGGYGQQQQQQVQQQMLAQAGLDEEDPEFVPPPEVKCGCGIVLQQKVCQNGSNAGRPFLACPKMRDDPTRCRFFQWNDGIDVSMSSAGAGAAENYGDQSYGAGGGGGRGTSGQCFTCGQSGHWSRDCPMKKAGGAGAGGGGYGGGGGASTAPCFKCGEIGHYSRDCPNKGGYGGGGGGKPYGSTPAVGRDTCYKCGQAGHWSSKCPNK